MWSWIVICQTPHNQREMFYLTTHSTHFMYGYMASDIWLRTILIVRKETRCRHIGYSYRLTSRVLLYAPYHRQDSTYHGLCYTSRGALARTRNSSMGPPHERSIRRPTAPWANALPLNYVPLPCNMCRRHITITCIYVWEFSNADLDIICQWLIIQCVLMLLNKKTQKYTHKKPTKTPQQKQQQQQNTQQHQHNFKHNQNTCSTHNKHRLESMTTPSRITRRRVCPRELREPGCMLNTNLFPLSCDT